LAPSLVFDGRFGRDGLITAMQMLWIDPGVARGVLKRLARLSGEDHRSGGGCPALEKFCMNMAQRRNGGAP